MLIMVIMQLISVKTKYFFHSSNLIEKFNSNYYLLISYSFTTCLEPFGFPGCVKLENRNGNKCSLHKALPYAVSIFRLTKNDKQFSFRINSPAMNEYCAVG